MSDLMRVKIQTHGDKSWQISVRDADTGRALPVMWSESDTITLRHKDGYIVADVTLLIDEIDVDIAAVVSEERLT